MSPIVTLLFHDIVAHHPEESGFSSPAADRYKLTISQFDAELSALQEVGTCLPPSAPRQVVDRASDGNRFIITADDGGVSYYTQIADRLEQRGWRGACFVTTDFIGRRGFLDRRQIRALADRGHEIGSHSASHPPRFSACSREVMLEEWRSSRAALEDLLGHPVRIASLPGGYLSRTVVSTAADAGYTLLFTSEPTVTATRSDGCTVAGRFTIRQRSPRGLASALVRSPWTRAAAWAQWNAKSLAKPLLGALYPRIADWLVADK